MCKKESRFLRFASKKIKCIKEKGGKCEICHLDLMEQPWVAHFHHLKDKQFAVTSMLDNLSLSQIKKEIDKCQLLCGHCHAKEHFSVDLFERLKPKILEMADRLSFDDEYYVSEETKAKIQELAKQSKSIKEIAKQTGLCTITVRKYVLFGVFGNDKIRKITNQQLQEEKFNGMSLKDISIKYGLSYKTVWKRWKKLNDRTYTRDRC